MEPTTEIKKEPVYFEDTRYNIGHIKPGQGNIKLEWVFQDIKKDQIEEVKPQCGCTAKVDIKDDRITAVYTDGTARSLVENTTSKRLNISKFLNCILKPTEEEIQQAAKEGKTLELYVENDRGNKVLNPDRKKIGLSFNGTVVLE